MEEERQQQLLREMMKVVEEAGEILLGASDIEKGIYAKEGRKNFVTEYDRKVQDFLFEKLALLLPEAVFVGEEEEHHPRFSQGYAFVIDPIDGTTNFMKGYCISCISVGLLKDGRPFMAVVYNPYLKEMFYGRRGKGAFCNGKPIHVSEHELSDGLVIFGTSPYYEELARQSFDLAYVLLQRCIDVRRSGSAAIDLCNIACGRAELFFELRLSPWDFAAAALLVEEAGGCIQSTRGEPLSFDGKTGVVAGNQSAVAVWKEVLAGQEEGKYLSKGK